ncbi:MAG: tetratricopeptide repeat protein, partial [Vicinamibacterales bacterium]
MVDNPRINELRRRVQADPASIAFAQLAEECRRAGANDEAVTICRNGLARHPGYLSARVTLGRALIELGELDDARHELDIVVLSAPDNMAAIRGLAEICQQQGRLDEALEHYRHALALASHDADLEDTVDRISQAIAPPLQTQPTDVPAVAVEELFDFDKLLAELGEVADHEPEPPAVPLVAQAPLQVPEVLRPTGGTDLRPDDVDEFAAMERELRAFEDQRAKDEQAARELRALEAARQREADEQLVRELEEARLKSLEEDR